jgi:hypothetical protein
LVQPFEQALVTEQEHLMKVRTWLAAGQGRTSQGKNARRKAH